MRPVEHRTLPHRRPPTTVGCRLGRAARSIARQQNERSPRGITAEAGEPYLGHRHARVADGDSPHRWDAVCYRLLSST